MTVPPHKTTFDIFFEERDALFFLYKKGDLTKKEFIEENYFHIKRLNLKPFKKIDSFEKGIYNYQYYNALAKYGKLQARDKKLSEKHPELMRELEENIRQYYRKKDEALIRLLRFLDFENVEAYFVKSKSEALNYKLFEVVLLECEYLEGYRFEDVVFHSINPGILAELRKEGVFTEERKKSRIDDYVNRKY